MDTKGKLAFLFNPSLPNRLKAGVLIAFVVLLFTSYVSYKSFKDSINETDNVRHTFEVKVKLEEFFSAIKDANRGVSGLLLRNDRSYYTIYRTAKEDVYKKMGQLQKITVDNDIQQANHTELKKIVDARFECLDSLFITYNSNNKELLNSQLDRGKLMMDSTERLVIKMRKHEDGLLKERKTLSLDYFAQSKVVISIFMVVAILIISICFYLLMRSLTIIREKEKTYRNIFEYSRELLFLCKTDFTVLEANPIFYETFKLSSSGGAVNINHLFASKEEAKSIRNSMEKGEDILRKHIVFNDTNNEQHTCYCNFIVIDKAKKIYSVMFKDITERLRLEQEREAIERFANIGRVSRVLAHEVRNPLTNINLALEGLNDENRDEKLKDYFGIIERNSTRINKLITELLNSTRPTVLEYGPVDISDLLEDTLQLAKDRAALKHIAIQQNFKPNLATIHGDKDKLGIALLNIVINAIEAMPQENGQLVVDAVLTKNKTVAISIKDNGIGMDKETVSGIFQPFFTKKSNGTGLGLASTQNIILTHKGNIKVDSELGKGTTFTVSLPLQ